MKIVVLGAGNGGVFTALHFSWFARIDNPSLEVELIYDPTISPEPVGQATVLDAPSLLWGATGFNWYNNTINATFKSGILYEGWGKLNDKVFHPFPGDKMAMHYCPWRMQKLILESGHFKVTEGNLEPKDVDADYVIDCRGKPKDFANYKQLKNPINSSILGKPKWDTSKEYWSRHVATPDGWTFVIPTHVSSPSNDYCVGYCFNKDITAPEDAEQNFLDMFDVEVKKHVSFNNYVAEEPVLDQRVFLNGNRLFFLEPLESSSTEAYITVSRILYDFIVTGTITSSLEVKRRIHNYVNCLENFVLWHYMYGSKYDTPFWDYAKKFSLDVEILGYIAGCRYAETLDCLPHAYGGRVADEKYAQWHPYNFKVWLDGMEKTI